MKFDSTAIPVLPNPQELTELNDLLLSATELYKTYSTLEGHPRVLGSNKSVELFSSCREQLHQDVALLDKQLETLLSLSRYKSGQEQEKDADSQAILAHQAGTDSPSPYLLIPDVEPTDINKSVFEIMRKCFHNEDLLSDQSKAAFGSARGAKPLKRD